MLNYFYDKFIMTSTLRYTHNNFYLLDIPFAITPTETLIAISSIEEEPFRKKLYETIKKDTNEKLLAQFSFNFGLDKKKELDLFKDYLTASGWGSLQMIDFNMETKRAIVVEENSPIAVPLKGKSAFATDTILRGLLAGAFSKVFEEDIDCVEAECAAQNSERCKFILKPKKEFDFASAVVQQQLSTE